jgi:SanA protein
VLKIILLTVFTLVFVALAITVRCNYLVCSNADGRLYNDVDAVPQIEVGLLLGTTPQTRIGRRTNQFFKYRINATEALTKPAR